MFFENLGGGICKVVSEVQFLVFLFCKSDECFHELEPDESSLRYKLIAFIVGTRHRVSRDEGEVNDLQRSIFADDT